MICVILSIDRNLAHQRSAVDIKGMKMKMNLQFGRWLYRYRLSVVHYPNLKIEETPQLDARWKQIWIMYYLWVPVYLSEEKLAGEVG